MVTAKTEDTVFNSFAKSGPWALLCLIMLLGVGFKANQIIDAYMSYVSESKQLIVKISESTVERDKVHASQLESLDTLQTAITLRADEHLKHEKVMQDILALMTEAKDLMQDVPQLREEQLVLLKRIDDGIQRLSVLLENQPPITEPE